MKKVIKCKLDVDSIQSAIDEIKDYRENIEDKLEEFMNILLQDGKTMASSRLGATQGDSTNASVGTSVPVKSGDTLVATVFLVGKDALFVEFGAGIAYNTGNQHPDANKFGYGIGTYPSKHPPNKAINPGRWVYGKNEDGSPKWSIGTQATMPIYYASETMRNNAVKRAKEVFRS